MTSNVYAVNQNLVWLMINILKILFPSENKGGRRVRPPLDPRLLVGSMKNTRRNLFQTSVGPILALGSEQRLLYRLGSGLGLVLVLPKLINGSVLFALT